MPGPQSQQRPQQPLPRPTRGPEAGEVQPGTVEEPDQAGKNPERVEPTALDRLQGRLGDSAADPADAAEIDRLADYLSDNFPDEVAQPPGKPEGETVVDVAIRLLTKLSASAHPSQITRCDEQFCNQPLHHTTPHGWTNVG